MPRWIPATTLALVVCCAVACAADAARPSPAIRVFTARETGGATRHRAIIAHPNGRIYAGNDRGLIEFSGTKWRAIPQAGDRTIYALAIDGHGRIWFAGSDRFGVLEPQADGSLAAQLVPIELPEAERALTGARVRRRIVACGEHVYVLLGASGTIARIDAQRNVRLIPVGAAAYSLHVWEDAVYVQTGATAFRLDAGADIATAIESEIWKGSGTRAVRAVWPREEGGAWMITPWGLRLWRDGVAPRLSDAVRDLLGEDQVQCGCPIDEGMFALGTNAHGVVLQNAAGEVVGRYDSTNGLGVRSDNVNALAVDADGRLWVAHEGGVSCVAPSGTLRPGAARPAISPRYSGLPLGRIFTETETGGMPQNRGIAITRDGLVYVGNQECLLEFDGVTWRTVPGTAGRTFYDLATDEAGRVWFAGANQFGVLAPDARGVLTARGLQERLPPQERDFGRLYHVETDGADVYFLAESLGLVIHVDAQQRVRTIRAGERCHSMFSLDGAVRVVGEKHCFRASGGRLEIDPVATKAFASAALMDVHGAFRFSDGAIGLADRRGLRLWQGDVVPRLSLAGGRVTCAVPLGDDRVALGTTGDGVLIVGRDGEIVARYDERGLGPGSGRVSRLAMDAEGGLWATHQGGVTRLQVRGPVALHGAATGLRGVVHSGVVHRGRVYAATTQGVFVRDPATGQFAPVSPALADTGALVSTEEGLIAAGTLVRLLRDDNTVSVVDTPRWRIVSLQRLAKHSDYLVASSEEGVHVYRRQEGTWRGVGMIAALQGGVGQLVQDASGWFWGLRLPRQLVRFDWRDGVRLDAAMETIGVAHGVPPLVEEKRGARIFLVDGALAISSSLGFVRHHPAADRFVPETRIAGGETVRSRFAFPLSDGAIWFRDASAELSHAFARRDAGGEWHCAREPYTGLEVISPGVVFDDPATQTLWIGHHGFVSYDLGGGRAMPTTPAARVRRVSTAGEKIVWGGAGAAPVKPLAPEQRALRFRFAAPSYLADVNGAMQTEYRTRLDGFEREWSAWSAETSRTYTNLPPGGFAFRVQARIGAGRVGPEASYGFRLLPPWWRTWWFIGIASASGIGAVAGITRWVANRALRRRLALLEAQAAVERERLRLARDLHDEVGSGLGRVILFAGEAQRTKADPVKLDASLTRVRASAQELVQHAREIVWAVSPQHDSLASVIERLGDYTQDTLRAAGIVGAVEAPRAEQLPAVTLGSEARHSLFLALKEAVHNCVKYSEAKNVELRLRIEGNDFVIVLRDDGRGFSPGEKRGTGHGLKNIVARLEALGGGAAITSAPGQGTRVELRLPIGRCD